MREIRESSDGESRTKSTIFEGILTSDLPHHDLAATRLAAEAQLISFAGEGTTAYTLAAATYELFANLDTLNALRHELLLAFA